jgi:hypothetical protein
MRSRLTAVLLIVVVAIGVRADTWFRVQTDTSGSNVLDVIEYQSWETHALGANEYANTNGFPTNEYRYWTPDGSGGWTNLSAPDQETFDALIVEEAVTTITNRGTELDAILDAMLETMADLVGTNKSDVILIFKGSLTADDVPKSEEKHLKK